MKRARKSIRYHGRTGQPVVHTSRTGRRFMMVRKPGGGTKRLYEGQRYKPDKESRVTKVLKLE